MPEPVTPDRFRQLVADESVPLRHRVLWALLREGNLRLDDLLSLDVRDVDFEALSAPVDSPKGERGPRTAPLSEEVAGMLRELIGGREAGPLFATPAGSALSKDDAVWVARRAGVSIHGFRLGGQRQRLGDSVS
ncbi:tyrosine-type recombinase/integrase [Streptomyces sp. NPDC006355]|uniref:tyrosine-type recombinase/integrase n=1 Tax=Streptomyces sp. NPDC006355 TaxID=3156758 RepID=UPI00339E8171